MTTHNVTIYQIKMKDDKHNKVFRDYSSTLNEFGGVKLSDYTKVYSYRHTTNEKSTTAILDEVYASFNGVHPENYKGRSISVSDIIVLDGIMYYVDKFGFKKIDIVM